MTRHLAIVTPPATRMVPTPGERRLCVHEMACLDGHIAAHGHRDTPASCPPGCRWWAEPRLDVEEYVYRDGAGALAQIVDGSRRGYHASADGQRLGQPVQPVRKAVRRRAR